jgi:hypothetical protein
MKKIDLKVILLLLITIFLIGVIFYTATLLNKEQSLSSSSSTSSTLPPVKIKAQSKTYTKTIALNTNPISTPTSSPLPTATPILTPTPFFTVSPTVSEKITSETVFTPTPTEILLARNITPTIESEEETNLASTPTARLTNIPESGYINNLLLIFSVATFIILFSLVF